MTSPTQRFHVRLRNRAKRTIAQALDTLGDSLWNFDTSLENLHLEGALPIEGDSPIEQAKFLCQRASSIVLFTGSGLSVSSGIKTFRGSTKERGLYANEEIALMTHSSTFLDVEKRVAQLQWHQLWKEQVERAKPNQAHKALAKLGKLRKVRAITQNIDMLLEQAFWEEGLGLEVVHLHGSLQDVQCHDCGRHFRAPKFDFMQPTPCARCQGSLRPGVVWFGEQLAPKVMQRARMLLQHADLCLVIGTSAQVAPAAYLPGLAKEYNVRLVEVNPMPTPCSPECDVVIRERAELALPLMMEKWS